jgi:hypothetical protein
MSALCWDDFDPELLARNIALRDETSNVPVHPGRCAPCADCAEVLASVRSRLSGRALGTVTPEAFRQSLIRHAAKFGPGCVAETAKQYGVDLKVRAPAADRPKRQQRTTPKLREEFARLYFERRIALGAVADVLNISDRRAATLRKELEAEGWHRDNSVVVASFAKPQKIPRNHAGSRVEKAAG